MSAGDILPLSMATLDDHEGPWTEEDWLALGETHHRIELLDGSLLVTPAPHDHHNEIMGNLRDALRPSAQAAGLRAPLVPNVRLTTGRVLIPDLAVKKGPTESIIGESSDVVLICEVTSPSNSAIDRGQKKLWYAEAGIPWYLLVEPDFTDYASVTMRLFRLDGDAYTEHMTVEHGETLTSEQPFPMSSTPGPSSNTDRPRRRHRHSAEDHPAARGTSTLDTVPMTEASMDDHPGPWTEEEFLALDETNNRIELIDGILWASPGPHGPHQDISVRLAAALLPTSDDAGFWVRQGLDVRVARGKILRPDLIIAKGPRVVTVTEASDVLLVCEVTSPSNAVMDRILKKELYAAASIKWYLLIEPEMTGYETVTLHLFRLEAGGYETYAVAAADETLTLEDPVPITIETNRLLGLSPKHQLRG